MSRTSREVFEDHLRISVEGTVEEDIARNYDNGVVILSSGGISYGYDGLRDQAAKLHRELPNGTYHYTTRLIEGEMAFLEWTAESDGTRVRHGADSYLIQDGRIVAQTIHYTVAPVS
ncbi:nuclear transport factor 2 family protein [Streptomyces pristinaespiralis]|uniref:nuclear transport factor 2 family protein n=1 Tax=Streptomyces pristinaespiralis TaxID=38300 RepID=UPI0033EAB765